ncbi:M10 family metallopeptidase C-terminal domain-containing protein [Microvirga alba]|uniref:PD40 domain-containing protein n=1 Tax=Microvirga alba TaxID=2791025 RepID=A0A931BRH0_9HYPH|nr:PD40 domain-containing protein [Microvirga alba]MBF9232420.1 PD40 domain-containing protein [Microvirga alba]
MPFALTLQSFRRSEILARVSNRADGSSAEAGSINAKISPDGRYVIFESKAGLVTGDNNAVSDIYLRDRQANTLTLVSTMADGSQVGFGSGMSFHPQITPDGRYAVFESSAQLVAGDTDTSTDIYLKDLLTNAITRISTKSDGSQHNGSSGSKTGTNASISADGRYVVFETTARLAATDTDSLSSIYLKDLRTNTLTQVSTGLDSKNAQISPDGRYVVFDTGASIYSKDLLSNTQGRLGDGAKAQITPNGRYMVFETTNRLVATDTDLIRDIYLQDLQTKALTRISTKADGSQADNHSFNPHISADGRYVVFESGAALVPADTDVRTDIYLRDLQTKTLTRFSTKSDGSQGFGTSVNPHISADGRYVVFNGDGQLSAGDDNFENDIYLAPTDTSKRQAILDGRSIELKLGVGAASQVAVAWGDGDINTALPALSSVSFSHVYAAAGTKAATVTLTEGAQTWTVPYTINLAASQMSRDTVLKDTLNGGAGKDLLTGDAFSNQIYGDAGNDTLIAGEGDDLLVGGSGNDVLTGNAGKDVFVFDMKPHVKSNVDKITDFNVKDDTIWLENKYFKVGKGSLPMPGKFAKGMFFKGTAAHDATDRIIYNEATGALYYDADGTGKTAQIKIATLKVKLALSADDFRVI